MTGLPPSLLEGLALPPDAKIEKMGGESGAPVWRVEAAGQRYALRARPSAQAGAILREGSALEAARTGLLPVPQVLRMQVQDDYACLLTTWCGGETLAAALAEGKTDPVRMGALCGGVQARMHAVVAPYVLGPEGSWLAGTPDEERILSRAPQRQLHRLLHLDLHPFNILTDGDRITGVVDWVNAGAGDPRQDVARSLALLHLAVTAELPEQDTANDAVQALAQAWLEGYEAVAGPLTGMDLFTVWAGLRTIRDLAPKRPPAVVRRMQETVESWMDRASL